MKNFRLIIGMSLLSSAAFAQNWTGAVSSDWNNSGNWSTPPTNGASITINPINYSGGAFSPNISSNSVFTISGLQVVNGAVLTIGANLTTTGNVNVLDANSEVIINQGTFNVNFGGNGRLIADLQGAITVNGGTVNVGQRLISGIDALITINDGTVTTNERFLMDGGGKIIVNDGVVNVGEVMALADGGTLGSSYYEQNGGVVTVTGETALENEAGNFQPTILINGGTFTLNGDLFWFGASPGEGTPKFITNGGIVTINGTISNLPLSTVQVLLDIKGNSVFNFNGANIDLIYATDSIKQSVSSTFTISGTNTLNNEGVVYATNGLVVFNGTTSTQGNGLYVFNDVTISSNKTLTHTAPFEIFINGNFVKMGTFNPNANKVTLNGNLLQNIDGTSNFSFAHLEINNPSGVSLNHPISVSNVLTLTNGILSSTAVNMLTMTSSSSTTSGSDVSFVEGPVKKIGNTAFVFPIGKDGKWRRMSVSAPITPTSEITAEYFNGQPTNNTSFNLPLSAVSSFEFWQLEKSNPSDNLIIELYWEDALQSGITDCAATTIAHYNGASWDNVNSSETGVCTGNGNGTLITNSPQSDLGIFTIGYFGNVVSQVITLCNGESISVGLNSYSTSGNYIDVLTDVNNNDSTVITHLTVLPELNSVQNVQVCFGETFSVGSNTYNQSGSYQDLLVSINGCDSTVTTNLVVADFIDVSTNTIGIAISANLSTATSYQWLDCDNANLPISGAVTSTFIPSQNGNYAVTVQQGSCENTSACVLINSVGIENETENVSTHYSLFPNPNNGLFTIDMSQDLNLIEIEIVDVLGNLILTKNFLGMVSIQLDLTSFAHGLYFVNLRSNQSLDVVPLIKK